MTNNGGTDLGDTVAVIDASINTVLNTGTVGINPFGIVMNPAGGRVYVANSSYWNGDSNRKRRRQLFDHPPTP